MQMVLHNVAQSQHLITGVIFDAVWS